jgi:hypothetical protein
MNPQRGLCSSAPCGQHLIARAGGAAVVSSALQRGVGENQQFIRSPVGTALGLLTLLREERKDTNPGRLPQMSNFYCHPGKAGGSPTSIAITSGNSAEEFACPRQPGS